jgi:hypothetical protein
MKKFKSFALAAWLTIADALLLGAQSRTPAKKPP